MNSTEYLEKFVSVLREELAKAKSRAQNDESDAKELQRLLDVYRELLQRQRAWGPHRQPERHTEDFVSRVARESARRAAEAREREVSEAARRAAGQAAEARESARRAAEDREREASEAAARAAEARESARRAAEAREREASEAAARAADAVREAIRRENEERARRAAAEERARTAAAEEEARRQERIRKGQQYRQQQQQESPPPGSQPFERQRTPYTAKTEPPPPGPKKPEAKTERPPPGPEKPEADENEEEQKRREEQFQKARDEYVPTSYDWKKKPRDEEVLRPQYLEFMKTIGVNTEGLEYIPSWSTLYGWAALEGWYDKLKAKWPEMKKAYKKWILKNRDSQLGSVSTDEKVKIVNGIYSHLKQLFPDAIGALLTMLHRRLLALEADA